MSNDTTYEVNDRLHAGRTVRVRADGIASIISTWLAELGAASPLAEDIARAARNGDWPVVHALGDWLSVDIAVAA
jgi:hypothetical protein